jgi:hypothetical protein
MGLMKKFGRLNIYEDASSINEAGVPAPPSPCLFALPPRRADYQPDMQTPLVRAGLTSTATR